MSRASRCQDWPDSGCSSRFAELPARLFPFVLALLAPTLGPAHPFSQAKREERLRLKEEKRALMMQRKRELRLQRGRK